MFFIQILLVKHLGQPAGLTLHFSYFVPKARELISRILRQGDKFMNKNPKDFHKYNNNANYLIRQILSK